MRVLIQRVNYAEVRVDNQVVGEIESGLLLFVAFAKSDQRSLLAPMIDKICNLRIFASAKSSFDLSLRETESQVLIVPQFTLYADTSRGRRPDFFSALEPQKARELFLEFVQLFCGAAVAKVASGKFGEHMHVKLENDGPATIMLELGSKSA